MRKIKKINGFLVVKFNDREKREYEGTALGEYGVIDAEVYTGNLDIDRGAMEYDDADTLEVAVELARGLESEEDITDEPPTYTAAVETNESYTEEAVEPAALIECWTRRLATQVKSKHYPDTDPRTAVHELYATLRAIFRSPGQSVPQPIPIISEDTAARGVEKVIFKKLSHKGENKRGQLTATLELWEYIPQTITAKSGSSSGSGKSGGSSASNLKANYKDYLSNDRGKSPARDDADTTAAMNKVTAMPY